MYKIYTKKLFVPFWYAPKIMLIMRLTTVLLIATILQVSAAGFAQKIYLSRTNAPLKTIIKELRGQSGYDFLYTDDLLAKAKPVNIKAVNMDFQDVLKHIFKNQPLTYSVNSKTIVISEKENTFMDKIINYFRAIDVTGKVVDEKGAPMVGATVKVKGNPKTTTTDQNGSFVLTDVEENAVLEITYVGFKTVSINAATSLGIIRMEMAEAGLQEVEIVNTGYQTIQQTKMTGSVTTIGAEEISKRNSTNILQNLEGVVPGLVQTRLRTTIRGLSSIANDMRGILYVVDGLPIEGNIQQINPYDIESVSALKDAAAAAIYGARASNGVIVITTKKAKEVGRTVLEASSNITVTEKPDYSYRQWMTPSQQVDYEGNYYRWFFNGGGQGGPVYADPANFFENNYIKTSAFVTPVGYGFYQLKRGQINQAQLDARLSDLKTNDFLKQYRDNAIQTGLTQQYNLALRTNNGKSQNSLVVNYTIFNNGGNNNTTGGVETGNSLALINAYTKSLNLFYKGSYSVGKWLELDYGVNSVIGKIRTHNSEFANNPANVPAYLKLLNEDGSRNSYYTNRFNGYNPINAVNSSALASFRFNHLDELERDYNENSTINTRYYLNLNIKPIQGLTINPMFQVEDGRNTSRTYSDPSSYTMRIIQNAYTINTGTAANPVYSNLLPAGGKLGTYQNKSTNYTARAQANYTKDFGKHSVIALAGSEFRQTTLFAGLRGILLGYDDQYQTQATNQVNFGNLYNMATGTLWDPGYALRQYHFQQISSNEILPRETQRRFASGYANVTYTYASKYSVFGSARKDYANVYGSDEKYRGRPLWSAGGAWVASSEEFLKPVNFINYLKMRGSYGLTGNTKDVTAYLAATTVLNPVTQVPGANILNPPNPQLRWEKTATINLGIDFNLLSNRLRGTFDWYRRSGTDLFALKRLDPSEGFTEMTINNADMINKGVELSLAYDWSKASRSGDFAWSSNITGSINNNKITSVDELTGNPNVLAQGNSFKVGYPVASIFAFRFAGLNNLGQAQFYNAVGQPSIANFGPNDANAIAYMGSEDPRYNLSFNNDFSFKGFTLSVFAIYQGGNYFRARQVPTPLPGPGYVQMPSYLLNSWTPTNTNTDIPGSGQYYQASLNNHYQYSDNLVRPADFFKIRNIVLGYDIPRELAAKIMASNVRFRFQINNPNITWYKQKDIRIDAETNAARIPTSFVFGLNANF